LVTCILALISGKRIFQKDENGKIPKKVPPPPPHTQASSNYPDPLELLHLISILMTIILIIIIIIMYPERLLKRTKRDKVQPKVKPDDACR